jgi:histidinol-phosphate aminotransferase
MIKQLIRSHLLNLKPYSSARDEYKGNEGIFLDANENALGTVASEILYNRYPDPHQWALKHKLAQIKNTSAQNIFIGNGSDEPIDLLIRLLCNPVEDNVVICPPTYGMYAVSAAINNVVVKEVLLKEDFQLNTLEILAAINDTTKIIFVCTPNNPTGNNINPTDIELLLQNFKGIVVVDEAYIDFTTAPSFINKLEQYENLVVLQTFSKAWGLANLRVGVLYGNEVLIQYLDRIKPPYNVNGYSQQASLLALNNLQQKENYVNEINAEKIILSKALQQFSFVKKIFPTDANFLLIKVEDANDLYNYLVANNIVVRNRSTQPLCENTLRITVGTASENKLLLQVLSAYNQ